MAKSWLLATVALISSCVWAGPKVAVETTLGNFTIELNQEKAPISVANFLRYVDDGSYVGSQFHRVIPGFMAQGVALMLILISYRLMPRLRMKPAMACVMIPRPLPWLVRKTRIRLQDSFTLTWWIMIS